MSHHRAHLCVIACFLCHIRPPPRNSSSQGSQLQLIEFAQQSVSGDSWETGAALLVLLCFALAAAAYVFNEGMKTKVRVCVRHGC